MIVLCTTGTALHTSWSFPSCSLCTLISFSKKKTFLAPPWFLVSLYIVFPAAPDSRCYCLIWIRAVDVCIWILLRSFILVHIDALYAYNHWCLLITLKLVVFVHWFYLVLYFVPTYLHWMTFRNFPTFFRTDDQAYNI